MKARTLWIVGILLAFAMIAPGGAAAKVKGDKDRNGIPDQWEIRHGLKKKKSAASKGGKLKKTARKAAVRVAQADPDSDDLSNLEEWQGDSDPTDSDTDGDGVLDGDENGLVLSFNGHYLRVFMPGEGVLEGVVDEDTLVFCEPDDEALFGEPGDDYSDEEVYEEDTQIDEIDLSESAEPASAAGDLFVEAGLCDASIIEVGDEVIYADEDDGYFDDVTLNVVPPQSEE